MNLVYIDFGHGKNTPGKESPDGTLKEYANNRVLGKLIGIVARSKGITVKFTVDGDDDPSLTTRATVANNGYRVFKSYFPQGKAVLVSCHSDASKNGEWGTARGFSVWTTKSNNNSDKLAKSIWKSVNDNVSKKWGIKMRKEMSDGDEDFESQFTLLVKTNFPCVIIENLFHDNREDVELLKNEDYLKDVAESIVDGIINYFEKMK